MLAGHLRRRLHLHWASELLLLLLLILAESVALNELLRWLWTIPAEACACKLSLQWLRLLRLLLRHERICLPCPKAIDWLRSVLLESSRLLDEAKLLRLLVRKASLLLLLELRLSHRLLVLLDRLKEIYQIRRGSFRSLSRRLTSSAVEQRFCLLRWSDACFRRCRLRRRL